MPNGTESYYYEIRVQGHLESHWETWFEGMTLTDNPNEETLLTGAIRDQAALHGVIDRLRDLGLPLLSVRQAEPPKDNWPEQQNDEGEPK